MVVEQNGDPRKQGQEVGSLEQALTADFQCEHHRHLQKDLSSGVWVRDWEPGPRQGWDRVLEKWVLGT